MSEYDLAGTAIRAVLRPGERLREHCWLLRSPGVESVPGAPPATRRVGLGEVLADLAFGDLPDAAFNPEQDAMRYYGRTFCGIAGSAADQLLRLLKERADVVKGYRPAWLALTDQRLIVLIEDREPPAAAGLAKAGADLLRETVSLGVDIARWAFSRGRQQLVPPAPGKDGFTGPLIPIWECPPAALTAAPAEPALKQPREILWFPDGSWLIVSFGGGTPQAGRMAAALRYGTPR